MSVQAITWAYEQGDLPGLAKFVLVTLCNRADEDWSCYPSIQKLIEDTGFKDRAVRDALALLEARGCMTRDRQRNADGSLGRYRYYIQRHRRQLPVALPASNAGGEKPKKIQRAAANAAGSPTGSKRQILPAADAGQVNRQLEPSEEKRPDSLKADFETLWAAWPAKGRERSKAKSKVLEQFRLACHEHPAAAITAAARQWLKGKDPVYVPALDRWLRDGKYEHCLAGGNVVTLPQATNWRAVLVEWLDSGIWPAHLGPRPDKPGYAGPHDVLESLIAAAPQDHPVIVAVRRNLQPQEAGLLL